MSIFVGRVVGIKMQKTAKVEVCRMFLHPHVLKVGDEMPVHVMNCGVACVHCICYLPTQYIRRRKVFFAHDENGDCVEGDVVMIKSCFPISKMKHFTIEEILEKAPRYEPPPQDLPAQHTS